jgi:hypothetical protein
LIGTGDRCLEEVRECARWQRLYRQFCK